MPNAKRIGKIIGRKSGGMPDMPLHRRPDRIFTVSRLRSAFDGSSLVWCIMSCWNRMKLSQGIGIKHNSCVWAENWKRNGYSTKRDTTKLSCSMTIFGHMSQDRSRDTGKRWKGRSYPTHHNFQTLLLPTTICFDRWHMAWLVSISALGKKSVNGSIYESPQKTHRFLEMISENWQKDAEK